MPFYTYQCEAGHVQELVLSMGEMEALEKDEGRACGVSGCTLRHVRVYKPLQGRPPAFHEGWYENCGPEPVYCSNAQQLQDACDRGGTRSKYLETHGTLFGVRESRWV